MDNADVVQVPYALAHLLDHVAALVVAEEAVPLQARQHAAALEQLHEDVHLLGRVKNVVHRHDIGMADQVETRDLRAEHLGLHLAHLLLVHDLARDLFSGFRTT